MKKNGRVSSGATIPISNRQCDSVNLLEIIGNASIGGMENYIKNFIRHLPPQFKVTCICPYESAFTASLRKLKVEEVYITPIADDPPWRSIQLAVEVAKLHQIDIFHAHMPKAHVLAGIAGCLIKRPVAAAIHGMNITSHELGIARAVGSHLITNCQEAYSQALAMGIPSKRVSIVRNSVEIARLATTNTGKKLRHSIAQSGDPVIVGFVGRLEHEKGPDQFLRAAQQVLHLNPDVHFALIGEGSMEDELRDLTKQLNIGDHVHFLGWQQDPAEIYPGLDIVVHTSRSDGTSLVLLEAMSFAKPTVGMAVGGVREIIENQVTGLIVGQGDWEGVAIKINELVNDPAKRSAMGQAARERVERLFNVAVNTNTTANILRKIAFGGANVFNIEAEVSKKAVAGMAENHPPEK